MATYTPEIWSTLKAIYQSGKFQSVEELQKHCKKALVKVPSVSAIQKRMQIERDSDDPWDKHAMDDEITERTRKGFLEYFDDLGYTQRKRAELIIEGVQAYSKTGDKIINFLTEQGIELTDELRAALGKSIPDLGIRQKYLTMMLDLTGEFQPHKIKGTYKQVPGSTDDEKKVSKEDLLSEMSKFNDRFAKLESSERINTGSINR